MPQININEIDQSVFRRVVDDDKVKVLVPCIASFGPIYDPQKDNAMTFTDVQAFEKVFGYTEPEYNPFPDDVSRTYIKQLINHGAAVSVVRVNDGLPAYNNINTYILTTTQPSDWTHTYTLYYTYDATSETYLPVTGSSAPTWEASTYYVKVATAAMHNDNYYIYTLQTFTGEGTTEQPYVPAWTANTYYTKNSDGTYTLTTSAPANWGTPGKFYTRDINPYLGFISQITGLKAKYTGSFGNHLLVTFTPVTSINVNFPYQYSIVTVYNADILVKSELAYTAVTTRPTDWAIVYVDYYKRVGDSYPYTYEKLEPSTTVPDATGDWPTDKYYKKEIVTTKTITSVHKLEDHMVTTNPNDNNYIEDVEFNFIKFELTPTAREEFTIVWSNIGNTTDGTLVINGFPEIPLKYKNNNINVFNQDALMDNGYDFRFNSELIDVLDTGYKSIIINNSSKFTVENVNEYTLECYAPTVIDPDTPANTVPGIVPTILNTIKDCYINYSDPYIYDFDFITSGGFINENFTIYNPEDNSIITTRAQMSGLTQVAICKSDRLSNDLIPSGIVPIHAGMLELVRSRKDCIALADVNPGWDANELPQYVEYLNESQCTVHSPWCYTADPYNNNKLTLMPPSFVFLYTLLSNLINSPDSQKWFPPAGVTRATARVVVKPYYEIGSTLLNKWQNDTLARVNPIMRLKNYGYVIYGQYTSYVAIDQFTHSALESLNVRLVSNCVKKQIFNLCLKLAFEPNNSSLWFKFYDGMDKYLLFMKRNDGVYDYRIQMDESTVTTDDINELRCPGKVWINPTRTAEFFDIDFILTEAGVTFSEEGE